MATDEYAAVVVGLGGFGSAAAYRLAKRLGPGAVLGVEQFELGHDRGASQDHSRIIRRSYHTPFYVRLADAAYRAWTEVEDVSGERLVVRTGGLDLWPADPAIPMDDYVSSLRAEGVPFDELDAGQVTRRWPQWRLEDDVRGVFQEDGGLVAAALANEAHRRLAVEHGARLLDWTKVLAVRDLDDGVEIELTPDGERVRCERLVVAADAWTNELLADLGATLPLTVTREQVHYHAAPDPGQFAPERFPVWIWMDDPSFYGLPAFVEPGPKIGQDVGGEVTTAETRSFEPNLVAQARAEDFLMRHLPGSLGPLIATRTCLYTLTPDRDFVLDAVPGHPRVLVALGAAHGFKFAALIGRVLADLAADGSTDVDLEPFRFDRPALTSPDPRPAWLV
jgi:sarcosine oxidase